LSRERGEARKSINARWDREKGIYEEKGKFFNSKIND
jgi:hypothetical protein